MFENYIFARLRGVNAWKTKQKIILLKKNEELMNLSCQMIFLSDTSDISPCLFTISISEMLLSQYKYFLV